MKTVNGEPVVLMCHDLNGVVPTEIQLVPYGQMMTSKYGLLIVDDEAVASVMAFVAALQNDQVIDYEHQSWAEPPIEAPAAGWIKQYINKGIEGIWGGVEWTEKARRRIEAKEYRYFSPVTLTRKDGKVMGLLGGGLTNLPNIDGMVPLTNKGIGAGMIPAEPAKEEGMKKIFAALGLPDGSTADQCVEAIGALKTKADAGTTVVANKAVLEALGLKDGVGESEVIATVMAHRQAGTAIEGLSTQVKTLTEALAKKDGEDLTAMVNKAIGEGRITPAQKDWALQYAQTDSEGFKIFLSKAPTIVVTKELTPPAGGGDEAAMDATQVQVNKMLGVNAEAFKKYGGKAAVVALLLICLFCGFFAQPSYAALSADRDTVSRSGQTFELGVATGVKIYKGALVAVNASGYATPGATATTLVGLCRADATVDNTAGQNGDLNVRISRGVFRYANSADADAIANDDIGKVCYIVDDATVALTDGTGTRSPAGRIFGVDSAGVWVEFIHFSAPGTIVTADISDDQVTNAKLANMTRGTVKVGGAANAPTDLDANDDGKILIGDGTDLKSVAVSGDITITNAGVTAIGAQKVTTAMTAPRTLTIVTDNTVLASTDCGKAIGIGTDAKTITLPSTVAGCTFTIINTGAAGNNIVEIVPAAADKIMGATRIANGTVLTILGADAEHLLNTKATSVRGDYVNLVADGVDGWYIIGSAGIWAEATP